MPETLDITRTTRAVVESDRMLTLVSDASTEALRNVAVFKALLRCSVSTGGYVQITPEYGWMPTLIGNDERPVFLYQLVEVLDGLVDYDSIKQEFPTLSYAQISGAIAFLRKAAQHNGSGVDIDALEDEADAENPQLIDALRTALNDREISRVLNND
jgi:hypothetical protein